MRKKVLILLIFINAFSSIIADSLDYYSDWRKSDQRTFFISGYGGAQFFISRYDNKLLWKKRITPTYNIDLGKWFTSCFGMDISCYGGYIKGLGKRNASFVTTHSHLINNEEFNEQEINIINPNINFLFNMSQMFSPKIDLRNYSFIISIGAGEIYTLKCHPTIHEITLNGDIIQKFRISSFFDFNLKIGEIIMKSKFSGEYIDKPKKYRYNYIPHCLIGITYNIGRKSSMKKKLYNEYNLWENSK